MSYNFGSFNTHQLNTNAYYQIPKTKLFTRLTSYYVHSDNDYKMNIEVVEEETQTLQPATVNRFHDAVNSKFIEVAAGLKNTLFVDTSSHRYNWNGEIVRVVSGTGGESGSKSLRNLDFENFVGRINLNYQLGKSAITLNHNLYY
ncbi:MAG: hypothetical protein AAF600_14840 [Bacteroidota bacterium]